MALIESEIPIAAVCLLGEWSMILEVKISEDVLAFIQINVDK